MAETDWQDATAWHELMSNHPEQSKKFYQEVANLKTESLGDSKFPYTLFTQNGVPVGGLVPPQNGKQGWPSGEKPHWVSSFVVDDVERAAKNAEKLGGKVIVPPTDIPKFGRAAVLKDPDGAVFGVFQPPE